MTNLTSSQQSFVLSICKQRRKALKTIILIFSPIAIVFLFSLYKISTEGLGEPITPFVGVIISLMILACVLFFYLLICLWKISKEIHALPVFTVERAAGVPKFKTTYFEPRVASGGYFLIGQAFRAKITGEINGVKYNFFSIPAERIKAGAPVTVAAITKKSPLLGCNWNRFVIEMSTCL